MQQKHKLFFFNFLSFASIAIVNSQQIPYLIKLGYSSIERGYLLAASAVIAIIGQFLFGYLCDHFKKMKSFFYVAYLITMLASFLFFLSTDILFYYHLLLVSLMGGMVKVVMSLNETWMLELDSETYGKMRAFGAIGMSFGSIALGYLIQTFDTHILRFIIPGIVVLFLFFIHQIPDAKKEEDAGIKFSYVKKLLKNKVYLLLVSIYLLVYMIGTVDQYVVIEKLLDIGGNNDWVGMKWAVQSIVEIPVFLFANKLMKKFSLFTLLKFGTFMYGIKFILYGMVSTPMLIVLCAGLQIVTLPIVLVTSKWLIHEISSPELKNFSQMFAMAIYIGVSGLITPLITSHLATSIGYNNTLIYTGYFAIIPFILIFIYQKLHKKSS